MKSKSTSRTSPGIVTMRIRALLFLSIVCGHAEAAPQAGLTMEDIIQGMGIIHDAFDPARGSYRVRFRQEQHTFDDQGKENEALFTWLVNDFARKGKLLYSHITNKIPSDMNPYDEWIVWDDNICQHRRSDGVSLFPDILPQAYNYFRYTDGIYADCYRLIKWKTPSRLRKVGSSPSAGNVFLLPRMVVENRKHYELQSAQELVDGDRCYVLEWPGRDKIWIDGDHGFVVRRRKMWFKENIVAGEQFNRDVFQARAGLWLPRHQEEHRYFSPFSPAQLVGKIMRISKTELLDISFRPLDDAFFKIPMNASERLLVNDNIRKIQYWHYPKGTDPVAAALTTAMHIETNAQSSKASWLLVNAIVIGILTLMWLIRGTRRPTSQ